MTIYNNCRSFYLTLSTGINTCSLYLFIDTYSSTHILSDMVVATAFVLATRVGLDKHHLEC